MNRAPPVTIFVYGTLRRGGINHRHLRTARFLGQALTEPRYTLHDAGIWPALVEGGTTAVSGQLYEVDVATLARLDRLEGVPDLFVRKTVVLDGGGEAHAWYLPLARASRFPVIRNGVWRDRHSGRKR